MKKVLCFHLAVDGKRWIHFYFFFFFILFSFILHKSLNPKSNIKLNLIPFLIFCLVYSTVWLAQQKCEYLSFYLQIKIKFICECWLFIMKECHEWLIQKLFFTSYLWYTLSSSCVSSSFLFFVFRCFFLLLLLRIYFNHSFYNKKS